jgi:acyl CoA:acetate/3-ketoacid CoA transferase
MSNINTSIYSGGYYALNGSNAAPASNKSGALASALGGQNASASPTAYLLDLSPDAQKYLQTQQTAANAGFNLTSEQTKTISDILQKYKDDPQTQETFNKIQDDLKAAGLSPERLSELEKTRSFDATSVLIKALNGDFTDSIQVSEETQKTKASNFIDGIIKQWQAIAAKKDDVIAAIGGV